MHEVQRKLADFGLSLGMTSDGDEAAAETQTDEQSTPAEDESPESDEASPAGDSSVPANTGPMEAFTMPDS